MSGGYSNESSGVGGFLIGIIVLVFVGIILSLMVDKRFRFSSGRASMEVDLAEGKRELAELRSQVGKAKDEWEKVGAPLRQQAGELTALQATASATASRLRELRSELATILAGREEAARALLTYRARYRQQVRQEAAGEKLDRLQVRSGRSYEAVTIRRVTAAGMEITHREGNSRLKPDELPPSWHERFQWAPGELQGMAEAGTGAATPTASPLPRQETTTIRQGSESGGPVTGDASKRIAALRSAVQDCLRHLKRADEDAERAAAEAVANHGKPVPGSLESWDERAKRMGATAEKFRQLLAEARAELAKVAPGDPLLKAESP